MNHPQNAIQNPELPWIMHPKVNTDWPIIKSEENRMIDILV